MPSREDYMYYHIHNGGITISIEDRPSGTVMIIKAGHYEVQTNEIIMPINSERLKVLSEFFKEQSELPSINSHFADDDWYGKEIKRGEK